MQTLLVNVKRCQVLAEPFPHLIVESPLPEDLYLRLASAYPTLEVITGGAEFHSNQRFSLSASQSLGDERISPLWREFVRLHTSAAFFAQVVELFGEHIRSVYPSLEKNIGALGGLSTGVRRPDINPSADALLDAQICVNTRVVGTPSSVRRVHVDSPNKLFTGLYYFRHPDDRSAGGDLEFYRFKGRPRGFRVAEVEDRYVEVVKAIKYRPNTFVMFINNIRALHGVTARAVTPFPRCFFNLVGEVREPLFDLGKYQKGRRRSYFIQTLKRVPRLFRTNV
ncbi:MAG TPA: hypothetical protein VN256_11095 [Pyrinomonadaceae bacterium]|nr:hypothetical protein [Pyrinomonadaceae bacterium]